MSELDPGVQVTLEMIGDELLKRAVAEIHSNLQDQFELTLDVVPQSGYGHHQTGQVQPSVMLQVKLQSKLTGNTIMSNPMPLRVLPDAWGKPYLST